MARAILTATGVILVCTLLGCDVNAGRSQLVPRSSGPGGKVALPIEVAKAGETDLIEQVVLNRQAYRQGLELLTGYYEKTGNNMKLEWAKRELAGFNSMAKYNYIIEASVAPESLRATTPIPEADAIYREAVEIENQAGLVPLFKDDNLLRLALDRHNYLIRKYPSSDKIDDAAYRAGQICEHFKDYTIAVLYYQRTYQWDPDTGYPARFRRAFVLDEHLSRRAEALEAYQAAMNELRSTGQHITWQEYARKRIAELTKAGGGQ